MVQVFLLISKLNMKLKCKNHTHGCGFSAMLTESINKTNNLGFTLNNHILRNHELQCNKCEDCKQECMHCRLMIQNKEWKDHETHCKKRRQENDMNGQARFGNRQFNKRMIQMYKFITDNKSFIKVKLDRIPIITISCWILQFMLMNFMKLLFIERFLRADSYYRESNIMMMVFTPCFFLGYFFSVIFIIYQIRKCF